MGEHAVVGRVAGVHALLGDGGGEGALDQAAVLHGGAGHVQDYEIYHDSSSAVCSAMAGEQVMPRPPGPVTSQTPAVTAAL
ncbi:hypothetical protein GCM10022255_075740 [Dactylosporangium darangshiense]|uniref:Uncharacterized protein n=1 Tax=Dactylosporangium darangshiense TaxID=579108 RepID=A0ABP8DJQ5_9ACTN